MMTAHASRTLRPLITSNVFEPRATLKGSAAVATMADDMRVAAARNGGVTDQELSLIGWTKTQIALHGEAARERAQKMANGQ